VSSTEVEPDGILRKACGNRREAVCPPCAERYSGDAYQLIAAGLRGGKTVPDTVSQHPAVFVTFTAPSFGTVHARALGSDGRPRRCRPRRDAPVCEHGVRLSCGRVRDEDDPCLGEPICRDCFDHTTGQYGRVWPNEWPNGEVRTRDMEAADRARDGRDLEHVHRSRGAPNRHPTTGTAAVTGGALSGEFDTSFSRWLPAAHDRRIPSRADDVGDEGNGRGASSPVLPVAPRAAPDERSRSNRAANGAPRREPQTARCAG
jgi:hypothetical protein